MTNQAEIQPTIPFSFRVFWKTFRSLNTQSEITRLIRWARRKNLKYPLRLYLSRLADEQARHTWYTRVSPTAAKLAYEFAMCLQAVEKIGRLWDISDDEDRQGLVRSLFSEVIFDIDLQRIVDFKLKPWADRFLVMRSALCASEVGDDNKDDEGGTDGGNGDGGVEDSAVQASFVAREAASREIAPMRY